MHPITWLRTHRLLLPLFVFITATPFAVGLAVAIPNALMVVLVGTLILLVWDRIHVERTMNQLADRIAAGDGEEKIEVRSGAWGRVCHSVNGLMQRQRLSMRSLRILPTLPSHVTSQSDLTHLLNGSERPVSILVIGYATVVTTAGGAVDTRAIQTLGEAAQLQVERHGGLLQHMGNTLLIAFGIFDERPLNASLQQAIQAAQAIHSAWATVASQRPIAVSLACGSAWVAALPGMGATIIGAPVDQAQRLQHLAATCPDHAIICSEDSYIAMHRLSENAWLPTDMQLLQPGRPPQVVYARELR